MKSLDVYLASCAKSEAEKIDFVIYSRITDIAAMHRIFMMLMMHRPAITLDPPQTMDVIKHHESRAMRLWHRVTAMSKMLDDPRLWNLGHTFDSLEAFRMPSGKRDLVWLSRADHAVSVGEASPSRTAFMRPFKDTC